MSKELINVLNSSLLSEVRFTAILPSAWPCYSPPLCSRVKKCGMTAAWLTARKTPEYVSTHVLRLPQTGAKYSQRQRSLRCEFCRGLERTRRQVAVPTLARKNRADVCERNTEARSCEHYRRGKAVSITYSDYVSAAFFYPTRTAHAPYCHLCPIRLYRIFPHYSQTARATGKIHEHKMCMFWFRLHFPETFFILRRNARFIIINVQRY